ncbi:MAG: hypothetical protein ACM3YE_08090 [Bacteroidota bacterium]
MKKSLLFLLSFIAAMTLVAGPSMAASVYFDPMVGGSRAIEIDPFSIKGDADQYIVGLEIPVDKFILGFEYFQGTLAGQPDLGIEATDFDGYELKGGFNLLNNSVLKMDLIANQFKQDFQSPEVKAEGTLVGADLSYKFSDKTYFKGSLGQSINAEYDGSDASILNYRFKLIYMFNRNISIAAGYRYYSIDVENPFYNQKYVTSGPVLSLSYNL